MDTRAITSVLRQLSYSSHAQNHTAVCSHTAIHPGQLQEGGRGSLGGPGDVDNELGAIGVEIVQLGLLEGRVLAAA